MMTQRGEEVLDRARKRPDIYSLLRSLHLDIPDERAVDDSKTAGGAAYVAQRAYEHGRARALSARPLGKSWLPKAYVTHAERGYREGLAELLRS